jgi:isopentenyldiphosphate isomerase
MYKKIEQKKVSDTTLKAAFRQFLVNKDNQDGFFRAQIRHAWPRLFGQNVAKHTRDLMVRKRKLYVYVDAATVRNQLMMVREGIMKRLNEELGEDYLIDIMIK